MIESMPSPPPAKIERVIFLDIEGVVVTQRSLHCAFADVPPEIRPYTGADESGWHEFIDKPALALVYQLARERGAQIVLTSTLRTDKYVHLGLLTAAPNWAKGPNGDEADQYLSFEVTPKLGYRVLEIRTFIEKHGVESFCVIDDTILDIECYSRVEATHGFSVVNLGECMRFMKSVKYNSTLGIVFL